MRSQGTVQGFSRLGRVIGAPPDKPIEKPADAEHLEALRAKYASTPITISTDSLRAYCGRAVAELAEPMEESECY